MAEARQVAGTKTNSTETNKKSEHDRRAGMFHSKEHRGKDPDSSLLSAIPMPAPVWCMYLKNHI
jgi:hypothetical protein